MTESPSRGRRPDETLTPRILQAAREELAQVGAAGFSIRQVASRAGVSRNAIAARWSSTDELLRDALGDISALEFETSGDLAADLRLLGRQFIAGLESGVLEIQLRVAADAERHPETYARMQERVLAPMSEELVSAFRSAQHRGQMTPGDVSWLVRAFVGAILARTFQGSGLTVPTPGELAELVSQVVRWARS